EAVKNDPFWERRVWDPEIAPFPFKDRPKTPLNVAMRQLLDDVLDADCFSIREEVLGIPVAVNPEDSTVIVARAREPQEVEHREAVVVHSIREESTPSAVSPEPPDVHQP